MSSYIQGEQITLYASFYDGVGVPISTGLTDASASLYHFAGASIVYDVLSGTMTQQAAPFDNIWYYNYSLPNNALVTTYNVVYGVLYSGAPIYASETFSVLPAASSFPNPFGQGSIATSGTVVDTSGVGIYAASVVVSSGLTTFASATTDISGNYVAYINTGTYLFNFFANGYYPTQTLQTIPSGTIWNLGTQVMQSATQGLLTISDTFAYQDSMDNVYPIPNLQVIINDKLDDASAPPYGVAYTNVSGTFMMNADPGKYTMTVQGEYWNVNTSKNDRYNYTYDIEVNAVWSGVSGQSPMNFQYLDTSKTSYL